jgi:predicted RNase H-like HicB family nuclease
MRFLVKIHRFEGDYSATVPDLPGCVAAADSIKEVKELIAKPVALHLELMRNSGEQIPSPRNSIRFEIDESSDEEFCTWVEVKTRASRKIPRVRGKKIGA